jgi:hypothetical protein
MTTYLIFSGVVLVLGLILMGLGAVLFGRQRVYLRQALTATGVVVELLPMQKSGDYRIKRTASGLEVQRKYLYRPVIRFKAANGRTHKFMANVSSRPAPYQVGEQVEVIYDPNKPHKAYINRFLYRWFQVLMVFGFGVFLLLMGLLGIALQG